MICPVSVLSRIPRSQPFLLLGFLLFITAFPACAAVQNLGPTPTVLPDLRSYDRYSAAQVAGHYQQCLKRVDPSHPDLQNVTAANLASSEYNKDQLNQLDAICMCHYNLAFKRDGAVPSGDYNGVGNDKFTKGDDSNKKCKDIKV